MDYSLSALEEGYLVSASLYKFLLFTWVMLLLFKPGLQKRQICGTLHLFALSAQHIKCKFICTLYILLNALSCFGLFSSDLF